MFEHDILYRQVLSRQHAIREQVRVNHLPQLERQSVRAKLATYLYRLAERLEATTDNKRVLGTR